VQPGSLAETYSLKTDDELLLMAADPQCLVEEARSILAEELRRRNLTPSKPSAVDDKPAVVSELASVRLARTIVAFLLNLANAIFGPGVMELAILPNIGFSRSVVAWQARAWLFSISMAALLGYFTARKWSPRTALWVWTLPVATLAIGGVTLASAGISFWRQFIAPDCLNDLQSCREFLTYTIPAVRGVAYSAAAWFWFRTR